MNSVDLHTVGLVVVQHNKLLLAYSNNKQAWYLPGGKIDANETSVIALVREVSEELGITLDEAQLKYYVHITAPAYGEQQNITMQQSCYIYPLTETLNVGNEIGGVKCFSPDEYANEPAQVPGVVQLFKQLQSDQLI